MENQEVDPKILPLGTFRGNVAHSCKFRAITTYDIGYHPQEETLFQGVASYHNDIGYMIHGTSNIRTTDSFIAYNNVGVLNFGKFKTYLSIIVYTFIILELLLTLTIQHLLNRKLCTRKHH